VAILTPHRLVTALLVSGLLALTSACATNDAPENGNPMNPTMTLAQANTTVTEIAEQARQGVAPAVQFTNPSPKPDLPCTNPQDGRPSQERRQASVNYQLGSTAPADAIAAYFNAMRTWLQANGFTIEQDKPDNTYIWSKRQQDGITLAFTSNQLGKVHLTVNSPCVYRNGTPPQD